MIGLENTQRCGASDGGWPPGCKSGEATVGFGAD